LTLTGDRSVARTGCSTRLVSEATADCSDSRSVVPEGIVTSLKLATGVAGADVAAEIGAVAAFPVVPDASAAGVFSGAFAPLHATRPNVNAVTQASFFTSNLPVGSGSSWTFRFSATHGVRLHRTATTQTRVWQSDNKKRYQTA
jgi:hypothetical protein